MKKRVLSLLMTGAMLASLLVGCGSTSTAETAATETPAATSAAAEATSEAPAAAATSAAAEASTSDISGDLNIIHYLTETAKLQALDDLVAGFEAEYPNVKVNVEAQSMDNYQDMVKLRISNGDVPDIIFGGPKTYSDLVSSGNIADLTNEEFTSRVASGMLDNVKVDGKVYGIPLDAMANVVFYNKDIFEKVGLEIPKTYNDFFDCCKKLKAAGYDACVAGYQDNIALGANIYTIYFGAPYLEDENYATELMSGTKKASEIAGLTKAMTQWREIMQYQNDDRKKVTTDVAEQYFASGKSGMIIIGTWGLGAIMNYNPQGNFGGFVYPSEDSEEKNAMPLATDDTWMLAADSKNPAAAKAFLEYATRSDVNAKWCGTTSQLSAIDGVQVTSLPQAAQDIANLTTTATISNWISKATFYGQYDKSWYKCLQDFALDDNMTIDQFDENLDNEFAAANK